MAEITKEIVETCLKYGKKYPNMTTFEIAKLCGISASSVANIQKGMYSYLLEEGKVKKPDVSTSVPYDEYRRLVQADLAIKELINSATLAAKGDGLFVDYHCFDTIFKKYFPEEYAKKMTAEAATSTVKSRESVI